MNCKMCGKEALTELLKAENMPIFQNKVYHSLESAKNAKTSNISLVHCSNCDYAYNAQFNSEIMDYDEDYQNEQASSKVFQDYLDSVAEIFMDETFKDKKIIEIGCGKGYFLEKLWSKGIEATGYDPTYEGGDERITKDYFTEKYSDLEADFIILRHTLEHIGDPYEFLKNIAKVVSPEIKIYIEVPSFEWIVERSAFWDVFYEHSNYFTQQALGGFFEDSKSGLLFGDQYQYVIGTMGKLVDRRQSEVNVEPTVSKSLAMKVEKYRDFVKNHPGLIVWGAAAKGSTFVNQMDPKQQYIAGVIDINPKKDGKFIAGSGHIIVGKDKLDQFDGKDILIMNENYLEEIKKMVQSDQYNFHVLS